MSPLALGAIAIVIFAAGAASGVKIQSALTDQKALAEQRAAARQQHARLEKIDVAATGHESDKAQLRTQFKTITEEVDRVVQKPVYLNVCFDDDGLRAAQAAIGASPAASQPASAMR